jgi:hypothetical protein
LWWSGSLSGGPFTAPLGALAVGTCPGKRQNQDGDRSHRGAAGEAPRRRRGWRAERRSGRGRRRLTALPSGHRSKRPKDRRHRRR